MRTVVAVLALVTLCAGAARAEDPMRLKVLSFNIWYGGDQVSFAQVIAAIRAADADIVGLQEPDGRTREIAAAAGYAYADVRRHILSKVPLFDPGLGERTAPGNPPYSIAGVDPDAVHAWALVAPGRVVAVANTHLTSDPYGPELARDGATAEEVLANERDLRLPEAEALAAGLAPLAAGGVPVVLTGDFNTPSHRDWTDAAVAARGLPFPVDWPVSRRLEAAGLADTFRVAHPDPVAVPGLTWTPGRPHPVLPAAETLDRIDFVYAANAEVVDSVVMGEAGNPAVALSVMPWPSDHRAVLTTLDVTPVAAPALIAVEPTLVRLGDSFVIRAAMPRGAEWTATVVPRDGDPAADGLTGIAAVDPADRPTIRLTTVGLAPGAYDAVLTDAAGAERARTRFSVAAPDARARIAVLAPTVAPGGDIAITFADAPGYRFDWVGIYRAGAVSVYDYLGFAYTGARREGGMTIPADTLYETLAPGDYEARLMFDDHYQVLATAPFRVAE